MKLHTGETEIVAAGRTAFSGIHTKHRISQAGFMLLWEDQHFYSCYYQNPVLGLKQKTQALCHKPSSCSLWPLIHEVLHFSYFNCFLAGTATGFFSLAHYSCSGSFQVSKIFSFTAQTTADTTPSNFYFIPLSCIFLWPLILPHFFLHVWIQYLFWKRRKCV